MGEPASPGGHLDALDLLRGVAAVVVLIFHAHAVFGGQWMPGGYLAVDVFFVMSGCVLAHAYERRLREGWGAGPFLRRRLVRFLPLHVLGMALGLSAEVVARMVKGAPLAPGQLALWAALGAAFVPVAGAMFMFPLNSPGWSLLHELLVNTLYAAVAPWLRTRALIGTLAVTGLGLAATVVTHGKADLGASLGEFVPAVLRTLYAFVAGLLLYRAWRVRPGGRLLPVSLHPGLVVAGMCLVFALPVHGTARTVADLLAVTVLSPLAVGALLGAPLGDRLKRLGTWLGEASFAVYALHWPVVRLAGGVAGRVPVPKVLVGMALVVGVLAMARSVERVFDRPIRTWLQRRA